MHISPQLLQAMLELSEPAAEESSARIGQALNPEYWRTLAPALSVGVPLQQIQGGTEGKDASVWERFAQEMQAHNGHPKAVRQVAIDMSPAFIKGVRDNFGNAQVVFDVAEFRRVLPDDASAPAPVARFRFSDLLHPRVHQLSI